MPVSERLQSIARLELESRLAELARVFPWLEEQAAQFPISAETRYAIELCLEEVLSNIVRHGYGGKPGHPIFIESLRSQADVWSFVIEDRAPCFDPIAYGEEQKDFLPALTPGGQGIRLLRAYAGSIRYECLSDGNRLVLGFMDKAGNREYGVI